MQRLCKSAAGMATLAKNISHVDTQRTRDGFRSPSPISSFTTSCRSLDRQTSTSLQFEFSARKVLFRLQIRRRKQSIRRAGKRVLLFHCIRQVPFPYSAVRPSVQDVTSPSTISAWSCDVCNVSNNPKDSNGFPTRTYSQSPPRAQGSLPLRHRKTIE